METTAKQSEADFKPIATKISTQAATMLDAICKKNGITIYELLQSIVDCAIRYMSDQHRMSDDLQRVMEIFFDDLNKSSFRLSDYTQEPGVIEAILILGDRKHKGNRSVLVTEPFFGQAEEDWNELHQLEAFVCKIMPRLYKRIRTVGAQMGSQSVYEVLDTLCRQALADDPNERDIREMFSDNERGDFGQEQLPESGPYVQHHNTRDHNGA